MTGYDEAVPAGRDLTAQDVRYACAAMVEGGEQGIADHLNRIARPSPRSWSLPTPPPDDVTVVHLRGDGMRCERKGEYWVNPYGGELTWGELFSDGFTVVEGEPPAPEPQAAEPSFAEGDRVRVKSTGRTGVLREIDSRGRHLIFGDDESWITGVRADNLDPAPEPRGYRKGFDDGVKYARDIDRTIARMTVPAAPVDEAHRYAEGYDPHETGSLLVDIRAAWLAGHRAALAAAGESTLSEWTSPRNVP